MRGSSDKPPRRGPAPGYGAGLPTFQIQPLQKSSIDRTRWYLVTCVFAATLALFQSHRSSYHPISPWRASVWSLIRVNTGRFVCSHCCI